MLLERRGGLLLATLLFLASSKCAGAQGNSANDAKPDAPVVTKIEPPSWWINLTPEVMLLLSGRNLDATHAQCNLPGTLVERTQSSARGAYLFVWLKISQNLQPGTAVCRLKTPTGDTSFEFSLASRTARLGRNQGLTPDDVIYLIMPDRFANGDATNDEPASARGTADRANPRAYHGGDLRGIRAHLPYVKELGATALWLTPVVENGAAQDYHGYGAVDLYAVDPHLGTTQDYRDLVTEAHQEGLKVIFDIVPNHVGPRHSWVADPPLRDWFHGTAENHSSSSDTLRKEFYGESGKNRVANDPFETLADPHAPPRLSRNLTDGWFFNILPDLNTENPIVAQYLSQNSIWWAESTGIDGYRVDTFPYVPRKFWSAWHAPLRRLYPYLTTIGEVFHPDPEVTAFFAGGQRRFDGIDSGVTTVFDYPMYFALRDVLLNDAPAGRLADVLRRDSLYVRPAELVTFFGNHDLPRFASADRSSPERLKLAFGLIFTLRGIPELYYGDEIGLPGSGDPDNRRDYPGGWPGDSRNAFTSEGRTADQQQLYTYVQTLLRLRRAHHALATGRLWHLAADDSSYVFLRENEDEKLVIAFNNSAQQKEVRVELNDTPAEGIAGLTVLFGSASAEISKNAASLTMPAKSISIFQAE